MFVCMFDVNMKVWFVPGLITPPAAEIIAGGNPLDFPQTPFEQRDTASLVPLDSSPTGALHLDPTGATPLDPAVVVRSLCGGSERAGRARGGDGSRSHAQSGKKGGFTITIIGNQTNQSIYLINLTNVSNKRKEFMAAILIINNNNNKILKKHSPLGLQGFAPSGSSLPPSRSCAVWGGKKDVITFLSH